MVKDLHEHPERLPEYRKNYTNVYPFSDGIFKMLMANEAKPERTAKFLNAMLDLNGENAIKTFTLGVPENPGVLNDKTAIFDIYGTTEAGNPVLIEVQQNFNTLFVDRLVYYTSRVISRTVKKSQDYNLPHIYVLSLLTENQFPLERNTYLHHSQLRVTDISFTKNWTFTSWKWRNFSLSKIVQNPKNEKKQTGLKCFEYSEPFLKKRKSLLKN